MLTTVLAFMMTIGVLVVIHEYGHYRAAVACDVKVLRFSVGFGKVLWRHQRGETEFVLSALPLGGYVKMLDEREGRVPEADLPRSFNRKTLWQRAFIVAAGPAANLVLAVSLYALVNWIGIDELRPRLAEPAAHSAVALSGMRAGDEIVAAGLLSQPDETMTPVRSLSDVQWRVTEAALQGEDLRLGVQRGGVPTAAARVDLVLKTSGVPAGEVDARLMERLGFTGPYTSTEVAGVVSGGPAERGGLRAGDRVLRMNGREPVDGAQFRRWVAGSAVQGQLQAIELEVDRAGQRVRLTLMPQWRDGQGPGSAPVPRIMADIGSPVDRVVVRYGALEGATRALQRTWEVSALSLGMLGKMIMGQASLNNLSGPLTIADYAGKSVGVGWTTYLGFLALVSVSLGVLNLLPLPVLDGGHLMYYLFEGVTGRPVPEMWLQWLQKGGVALMLLMMSLALYNDFARLFWAGTH